MNCTPVYWQLIAKAYVSLINDILNCEKMVEEYDNTNGVKIHQIW